MREDAGRGGGGHQALAGAHHRLFVPEAGLRERRVPQGDGNGRGDAGRRLPPGPRAVPGV